MTSPNAVSGMRCPSLDEPLIAAEAEIALALRRVAELPEGNISEALAIRADRLDRFIATTPPSTLAGAAVKLRRLLDPETGLRVGANTLDIAALAQVLALLQSLTGLPRHPTRPTCDD
jgi:hypothetical protein